MIEYPFIPYSAINATPGTGIAISSATRTTRVDTECAMLLRTTNAGGVVMPQRLSLTCRTAGTGVTAIFAALEIGTGTRYSSGGTSLTVSQTRNPVAPSGLECRFGNITLSLPTGNERIIWHEQLTTAAPTVGQRIDLNFDDAVGLWPQVAVPAGRSLVLYYWATGQSASPTFEPKLLFGVR